MFVRFRLLQQGSCTFATLYRIFHDGLASARLFLIACLRNPIINLIANIDIYLDIDFNKMLIRWAIFAFSRTYLLNWIIVRFSQQEKLQKFGIEGTPEYNEKVLEYRKWVVKKLVDTTNSFISSLQEHVHCFPETLNWLISQIAHMMSKNFPLKEVSGCFSC